jgi:hypothetical protein
MRPSGRSRRETSRAIREQDHHRRESLHRHLRRNGALDRALHTIVGQRVVTAPKINAQRAEEVGVWMFTSGRVIREESARLDLQLIEHPSRSGCGPGSRMCLVRWR